MATDYNKPLPVIDDDSREYWEAARRHELVVPRCDECGEHVFYPRRHCPSCQSHSLSPTRLSGRGHVYSYTVVRFPITEEYKSDVPYIVALIELEEGPRLMANVLECAPEKVFIGMSVGVMFTDVTPEVSLPQFKPA